jgi:hypothetical protein
MAAITAIIQAIFSQASGSSGLNSIRNHYAAGPGESPESANFPVSCRFSLAWMLAPTRLPTDSRRTFPRRELRTRAFLARFHRRNIRLKPQFFRTDTTKALFLYLDTTTRNWRAFAGA